MLFFPAAIAHHANMSGSRGYSYGLVINLMMKHLHTTCVLWHLVTAEAPLSSIKHSQEVT